MLEEEWRKDMTIVACVELLVLDAQFCLIVGSVCEDEGMFEEALYYYEQAEKGFIGAEQKWKKILDNWEWPPKPIDLKQLITTGHTDRSHER